MAYTGVLSHWSTQSLQTHLDSVLPSPAWITGAIAASSISGCMDYCRESNKWTNSSCDGATDSMAKPWAWGCRLVECCFSVCVCVCVCVLLLYMLLNKNTWPALCQHRARNCKRKLSTPHLYNQHGVTPSKNKQYNKSLTFSNMANQSSPLDTVSLSLAVFFLCFKYLFPLSLWSFCYIYPSLSLSLSLSL